MNPLMIPEWELPSFLLGMRLYRKCDMVLEVDQNLTGRCYDDLDKTPGSTVDDKGPVCICGPSENLLLAFWAG